MSGVSNFYNYIASSNSRTLAKESNLTSLLNIRSISLLITSYLSSANQYSLAKTSNEVYEKILLTQIENMCLFINNGCKNIPLSSKKIILPFIEKKFKLIKCLELDNKISIITKQIFPNRLHLISQYKRNCLIELGNTCKEMSPVLDYVIHCSTNVVDDLYFCENFWQDKLTLQDCAKMYCASDSSNLYSLLQLMMQKLLKISPTTNFFEIKMKELVEIAKMSPYTTFCILDDLYKNNLLSYGTSLFPKSVLTERMREPKIKRIYEKSINWHEKFSNNIPKTFPIMPFHIGEAFISILNEILKSNSPIALANLFLQHENITPEHRAIGALMAVDSEHYEITSRILESGNTTPRARGQILRAAVQTNNFDLAKKVIQNGKIPYSWIFDSLKKSIKKTDDQNLHMLRAILDIDEIHSDDLGEALCLAIKNNKLHAARLILDSGEIDSKNSKRCFELAIKNRNLEFLTYLLKDITLPPEYLAHAALNAARNEAWDIVKLIKNSSKTSFNHIKEVFQRGHQLILAAKQSDWSSLQSIYNSGLITNFHAFTGLKIASVKDKSENANILFKNFDKKELPEIKKKIEMGKNLYTAAVHDNWDIVSFILSIDEIDNFFLQEVKKLAYEANNFEIAELIESVYQEEPSFDLKILVNQMRSN